jgi:hypothetical protein
VKLIGVANVTLSSLITQSNQWLTLTGNLVDKDGKTKTEGIYSIRLRYHRDDQQPLVDEEEQIQVVGRAGMGGYLEAQEISFHDLQSDHRQNLYAECQLHPDMDWLHLTDIQNTSRGNSTEVKWTHLKMTGLVSQRALESTMAWVTLKHQHLPEDLILGQAQIDLIHLLSQTNQWIDLQGDLLSTEEEGQGGKYSGRYFLRLRYREESQEGRVEEELISSLPSVPVVNETSPSSIMVSSTVPSVTRGSQKESQIIDSIKESPRPEPSIQPSPAVEVKTPQEQMALLDEPFAVDETPLENVDVAAEMHLVDDEEDVHRVDNDIEERPPPTPTQEEIARSPRIGYWAEMTDESGTVYYYHTVTGETSWEPPNDLIEGGEGGDDDEGEVMDPHQDLGGSVEHEVTRNGDWIQLQDDGGNFYWYNEVTGQSSWELPVDDPELYTLPDPLPMGRDDQTGGGAYASASAGGYTIEL